MTKDDLTWIPPAGSDKPLFGILYDDRDLTLWEKVRKVFSTLLFGYWSDPRLIAQIDYTKEVQ